MLDKVTPKNGKHQIPQVATEIFSFEQIGEIYLKLANMKRLPPDAFPVAPSEPLGTPKVIPCMVGAGRFMGEGKPLAANILNRDGDYHKDVLSGAVIRLVGADHMNNNSIEQLTLGQCIALVKAEIATRGVNRTVEVNIRGRYGDSTKGSADIALFKNKLGNTFKPINVTGLEAMLD